MPATEQQLYWYMCLVLKDRLEDINMLESIIKISTLHPCGTALFDRKWNLHFKPKGAGVAFAQHDFSTASNVFVILPVHAMNLSKT